MNWLSSKLFGTPTTNPPPPPPPPQSSEYAHAQDETQTSDTASGPGTSPRGSPSDTESEASSNSSQWSKVSGAGYSERVARKRRSLPRLKTSGPSSPLGPRREDSRPRARDAGSAASKARRAGPRSQPREGNSRVDARRRAGSASKARRVAFVSEPRHPGSISLSPGTTVSDLAETRSNPQSANSDALPSTIQEAANEDVLPAAPGVVRGQVSEALRSV